MITIDNILSSDNRRTALARVVKNGGAAGIDEMPVEALRTHLNRTWTTTSQAIRCGKYRPSAVRRVEIPKPNGGVRLLGIPTVQDRMLQQATAQVLSQYYDTRFSEYSYGFRPNRNCHQAIDTALDYLKAGNVYMVEIDLSKFFDRVNHDRLMYRLSEQISDKQVLKLIRAFLQSGVMLNGVVHKTEEGTPQGGNLSPILSNIVLDELDKELEKRGHNFVRYADDITIFVKSRRAGERVLSTVSNYIERRMKLRVNREKSGVRHYTKGGMLGFGFYADAKGVQSRILPKSYQSLRRKLKRFTSRKWSVNFDERVIYIDSLIVGWIGYFGKGKGRNKLRQIEEWLRRRLRMCIWKQWKKVGKRMRSLIQLGATRQQAYEWANTRKSYWRVSKSPILHRTITNERLEQRGLRSLVQLYNRRHLILTNRRDTRTVRPVV